MKAIHETIRQVGNSQGVVIPKPPPRQPTLNGKEGAEMTVGSGALVLRKPALPARTGWAEAARKIAGAGDDALVMGEFGNAADTELVWSSAAKLSSSTSTLPPERNPQDAAMRRDVPRLSLPH